MTYPLLLVLYQICEARSLWYVISKRPYLKCYCVFLETEIKSEENVKDEDHPSQGEASTEREPEQPTESQTKTSQTKIAFVMAKLKSVLILFLVYGKWVLDKMIGFLNELSKDYRAVARQLKKARLEKGQGDSTGDYRWRDSMTSNEDSEDAKVGFVDWTNLCMWH